MKTMEYFAERSQLHLFSFQTRKYSSFFSAQNNVCYCSNIDGLFEALESEHHSNEWRLFIDSSKASLKAVLLNNGNEKSSILLVHTTALNETHETIELILRLINYSPYNWNISGNLKVIGLLLGMQIGYTKHQCFLRFWDSRDDEQHLSKKIGRYVKRLFQEGLSFTMFH